jgi:ABC-type transport system involved in multi-copper enzyme maturation permease subunit
MSRARATLTLAHHEYRAAYRSKVLVTLLGVLMVVTIASILIGALDYSSQLADYEAYRKAALAGGVTRIPPMPLQLLSLLRGAMEYIEIVGALIAIVLGYLSVTRERSNGTLPLLRTRPVSGGQLAAGSALGALGLIGTLMAASAVISVVSLGVIGHDWVGGGQLIKVALAYGAAIVYMMTFYCLAVVIVARSRNAANGLVTTLVIWLVVVLILPQIGDTLDADNQVPGGLFAALGLGHSQEVGILSHFGTYEGIRTGLEAASVSKHFERFAFAMTDVHDKYRGFTLTQLFEATRGNVMWIALYFGALMTAMVHTLRRQATRATGGM